MMNNSQIIVSIIGSPIACEDGVKDTWRQIATWAGGQLEARFGPQVQVSYFDLFDADCPALPENAQLPVVLVNETLVSNGGKISVPVIRQHIEGLQADNQNDQ